MICGKDLVILVTEKNYTVYNMQTIAELSIRIHKLMK